MTTRKYSDAELIGVDLSLNGDYSATSVAGHMGDAVDLESLKNVAKKARETKEKFGITRAFVCSEKNSERVFKDPNLFVKLQRESDNFSMVPQPLFGVAVFHCEMPDDTVLAFDSEDTALKFVDLVGHVGFEEACVLFGQNKNSVEE